MKYSVNRLNEDTWQICEGEGPGMVYMYFLIGEKAGILIDAGYGTIPLNQIIDEIMRAIGRKLEISLVITHGHVDHIGGAGFFERVYMNDKDLPTYVSHSSREMRQLFLGEKELELAAEPLAVDKLLDISLLFEDGLDLGGRELELIYTPGHSIGCVSIYDKKYRWMFTGDSCCKADLLLNMEYCCDLKIYSDSVKEILSKEFDCSWPGHHECPVDKSIVGQFLEASQEILCGALKSKRIMHPAGASIRYEYKDIAILEVDKGEK